MIPRSDVLRRVNEIADAREDEHGEQDAQWGNDFDDLAANEVDGAEQQGDGTDLAEGTSTVT